MESDEPISEYENYRGYFPESFGSGFEDEALSEITEYFTRCRDQRNNVEKQWERNYRQWRGIYDKSDAEKNEADRESIKSEIFIKMTQEKVSTAHAAIMKTTFPDEYFDLSVAVDDQLNRVEDDKAKCEILKETLKNLHRLDNRKRKVSQFVKNMCVYGTAIAKIVPESREVYRYEKQINENFDEFGSPVTQINYTAQKKLPVRPTFTNLDIRNVYIDIYSDDLQTAKGVIIRSVVSKQYLLNKETEGIYRNISDLEEKTVDPATDSKRERLTSLKYNVFGEEGIELLEFWGRIGDSSKEYIITVANQSKVIRLEENNFIGRRKRPFLVAYYDEDPGLFYGIGIPEKVEGSQAALNALWRAKIDNFAQHNNVETIVDVTKIYNLEQESFKRYTGKIWLTRGKDAIQFHTPSLISNDQGEVQSLERYIQEESGVPKLLGGQTTKGEQTATEVDLIMQNVSMVFGDIQKNLEEDLIVPMIELDYEQIIMFMSEPMIIKLAGKDGSQIIKSATRDDIFGNFDFKALGSSFQVARTVHNNQLLQFMQIAGQDPTINRKELYHRFLDNMGIKGVDKILTIEPVVPMQLVAIFLQQAGIPPELFAQFMERVEAEKSGSKQQNVSPLPPLPQGQPANV